MTKEEDDSYKGRERKRGRGHRKYRCETLGVKIVREKDDMNKSFPFFTYWCKSEINSGFLFKLSIADCYKLII